MAPMNAWQWATGAALAAASVSAAATQYATPEEAARRCFPEATAFKDSTVQLGPDEIDRKSVV